MRVLGLGVAVALAASAAGHASAIEGRWRTPTNNAEIDIAPCGAATCGVVIAADHLKVDPAARDVRNRDASLRGRRIAGLRMLSGFTGGPREWKGGQVYNPDDGGTYSGVITLVDPDHLKLRGCIVFPLCRTQVWTRIR